MIDFYLKRYNIKHNHNRAIIQLKSYPCRMFAPAGTGLCLVSASVVDTFYITENPFCFSVWFKLFPPKSVSKPTYSKMIYLTNKSESERTQWSHEKKFGIAYTFYWSIIKAEVVGGNCYRKNKASRQRLSLSLCA